MKNESISFHSSGVDETLGLGKKLGKLLKPGDIVGLTGNLGAGKTWFSKGIAFGLDVPDHEYVNSPAFDLVHEYIGNLPVFHLDFYRLEALSDEDCMWLDEYLFGQGVCIIEWAEKFIGRFTKEFLEIKITYAENENERRIEITAAGERYKEIIERMAVK